MTTSDKALDLEVNGCLQAARDNGWRGQTADFELTPADCESIELALGYVPTQDEYRDSLRRVVSSRRP